MNIESSNLSRVTETKQQNVSNNSQQAESSVTFADELNDMKKQEELEAEELKKEEAVEVQKTEDEKNIESDDEKNENSSNTNLENVFNDLSNMVNEFNQTEDKLSGLVKNDTNLTDNDSVINKDYSIQENKDLLPQMNPNMNFSGDGQPFSSFMNNEQNQGTGQQLNSSAKDLAEEAAILSPMAENIAIANKNELLKAENLNSATGKNEQNSNVELIHAQERTVVRNEGIKKVNTNTGITTETVVKFDSIIMNQADAEVFANLVEKGSVDLNSLTTESAQKTVQISKTLADMLAKAKESSQPLRIDFDNNISVIIRISRDGKITADFLPSSQVAEAYLKENLPLLRQRFDEKNIEYDSLNQRERRDSQKEQNRKKGRNDE